MCMYDLLSAVANALSLSECCCCKCVCAPFLFNWIQLHKYKLLDTISIFLIFLFIPWFNKKKTQLKLKETQPKKRKEHTKIIVQEKIIPKRHKFEFNVYVCSENKRMMTLIKFKNQVNVYRYVHFLFHIWYWLYQASAFLCFVHPWSRRFKRKKLFISDLSVRKWYYCSLKWKKRRFKRSAFHKMDQIKLNVTEFMSVSVYANIWRM